MYDSCISSFLFEIYLRGKHREFDLENCIVFIFIIQCRCSFNIYMVLSHVI